MFKVQERTSPRGGWKDVRFLGTFATEGEAVGALAQAEADGFSPGQTRIVKV